VHHEGEDTKGLDHLDLVFGPRLFGFFVACLRCSSMRRWISPWGTAITFFMAVWKRIHASGPSTYCGLALMSNIIAWIR